MAPIFKNGYGEKRVQENKSYVDGSDSTTGIFTFNFGG